MMLCVTLSPRAEVTARHFALVPYENWADLSTDTLMQRGRHYIQQPEYRDSALLCNTIVANRYYDRHQSDEERAMSIFAMSNIGYLYLTYYYDYQTAYNWLQKAVTLADKHHEDIAKGYALNNLGNLMSLMENINDVDTRQQGIDYYKQAWHIFLKMKKWDLAMTAANNIYIMDDDNPAVIDTLQHDISAHQVPRDLPMLAYFEAQVKFSRAKRSGDYSRAMSLCDSIDKLLTTLPNHERYQIMNCSRRAEVCSLMGDNAQSIQWIDRAKQFVEQYGIREASADIEKYYYEYYTKLGDHATARQHHLLYYQDKDSLQHQAKLLKANELHFLDELQKINIEAEQSASKARLWHWFALALLALVVAVGLLSVFLWRKNHELEENYRLMYRKTQENIKMEQALQTYRNSKLDENTKDDLSNKIIKVMEQTELICQENFNREILAELVDTTPANVSQVLSQRFNKNFNQLLGEYRIREACRRINDQANYGNLTIEAIGASVGFKSRSNFAANFKKVTGLTATQYAKEAKNPDNQGF